MRRLTTVICFLVMVSFWPTTTQAGLIQFDQNVTPNVIFCSGNANGGFTVNRMNGVEVGLRAKMRYPVPMNTFNSNGNGTYSHSAGGYNSGGILGLGNRASWNYEFSVNSNFDGSSGLMLDDITTIISIDLDPSQGTNFVSGDIFTFWSDNNVGTNATGNGSGVIDNTNLGNYNVAQNSQNLGFLPPGFFDASINGTYDFQLTAFDKNTGDQLAQTHAQVIVGKGGTPVPEPSSIAMAAIAAISVAGFVFVQQRHKPQVA